MAVWGSLNNSERRVSNQHTQECISNSLRINITPEFKLLAKTVTNMLVLLKTPIGCDNAYLIIMRSGRWLSGLPFVGNGLQQVKKLSLRLAVAFRSMNGSHLASLASFWPHFMMSDHKGIPRPQSWDVT